MRQTKRNNTNTVGLSERKVTKELKTYLKIQMLKMSQIWGRSNQILNMMNLHIKSMESESEVAQSCPTLCDPWTVAHQASPSVGFSRQEYWSEKKKKRILEWVAITKSQNLRKKEFWKQKKQSDSSKTREPPLDSWQIS